MSLLLLLIKVPNIRGNYQISKNLNQTKPKYIFSLISRETFHEFKLAKFLQLMGTIKRNIFKKVRTETILKIYNTLVLPTFLNGSENWTLTALQRRRIEAAEMKLLRPLAGYALYDHKTNDYIRRELRITGILDKIDEYRWNWLLHLQRMPQNRIPLQIIPLQTTRKENNWKTEEALARAAVIRDGTHQRVQSLMFMMMMFHWQCYLVATVIHIQALLRYVYV